MRAMQLANPPFAVIQMPEMISLAPSDAFKYVGFVRVPSLAVGGCRCWLLVLSFFIRVLINEKTPDKRFCPALVE